MGYFWVKTFHIVFVVAWMSAVFYLPRILVNIAEAGDEPAVRDRLVLMGRRLYRFGHNVFGVGVVLGLVLWLYYGFGGGWLYLKLGLVALLLVYFVITGRMVKGVEKGKPLWSGKALRWFNEIPLFLFIGVVWLVLVKPIL